MEKISEYNEAAHAAIVVAFYRALEAMGEAGKEVFIEATKHYAEGRGRRMAKRAEWAGIGLSLESYFTAKEWQASKPENFSGEETREADGRVLMRNYSCPWHKTFKALEALDVGKVYCKYIDVHLLKGFNPELGLNLHSVLHDSDQCFFEWCPAQEADGESQPAAKREVNYVKPFSYHLYHLYASFRTTLLNVPVANAEALADLADKNLEDYLAPELIKDLKAHQNDEFESI